MRSSDDFDVDDEIDIIFNFVDWMLINEHFQACNDMLKYLQVNKMSTPIIIAFLTITASAKDVLYSRTTFFEQAKRFIMGREGKHKTERLLDGLE
jgi:hypothetical protein